MKNVRNGIAAPYPIALGLLVTFVFIITANARVFTIFDVFFVLFIAIVFIGSFAFVVFLSKSRVYLLYSLGVWFFLCLPFSFATVYLSIEQRFPKQCIEGYEMVLDTIYFSYTTFTTLGYGDLKPLGFCRMISSVEAVSGYLSLGVLTALLFSIISTKAVK